MTAPNAPAPPEVTPEAAHRVLLILCLALAGSVVVMAATAYALVTTGTFPPFLGFPRGVRIGIGAFLLLLLVASYPIHRAAGGVGHPDDPHGGLSALQTRVIAAMAVREFVGIAGGLLILLSEDLVLGGTLVALSVATILLALPSREDVREAMDPRRGGDPLP